MRFVGFSFFTWMVNVPSSGKSPTAREISKICALMRLPAVFK